MNEIEKTLKEVEALIKSSTKEIVLSEEPNLEAWEHLRDALVKIQKARLSIALH